MAESDGQSAMEAYKSIAADVTYGTAEVSKLSLTVDGVVLPFNSPRMAKALKQTGVHFQDLKQPPFEKFQKAAQREGLKNYKAVAKTRADATEKRRQRVLASLVEARAKLVESGDAGLQKGPAPEQRSKQAEAAVAEQAAKAVAAQKQQMARMMESQEARLAMVQKVEAEAAALRMEREEVAFKVELKFAHKKEEERIAAEKRRAVAMQWEVQRKVKQELEEKIMREEGIKTLAAMDARDIEIEKKRADVRKEAAKIGIKFRAERAKKIDSILLQHREKEVKMTAIANQSLKKQVESEAKRIARLAEQKARVERENREKTAQAMVRLAAHEKSLVAKEEQKQAFSESRLATVQTRLEKLDSIKQAEIAEARRRADAAAVGREQELLAREEVREQYREELKSHAVVAERKVAAVKEKNEMLLELKVADPTSAMHHTVRTFEVSTLVLILLAIRF
jgi:hypothetical protein